MYDIVTFGSATMDILIKSKDIIQVTDNKFITGKGLCLPLGSKMEIDVMSFSSGGGGTNTAATFTKQGLSVAFCGMVGKDVAGEGVIEELKKMGVDVDMVKTNLKKATNHSVILTSQNSDRTILVWRGASDMLLKKDIYLDKIKKSKWFYLAPLSGKFSIITEFLIDFAHKNGIKVAMNPGYDQLKFPKEKMLKLLKKTDIFIVNQEEACKLIGMDYAKEEEIFKKLDEMVNGIVIMTKGKNGAVASDGKYLYNAPIIKEKIIDRTGAGDSFGSGFVTGLIQEKGNIEKALQLAVANSSSCLQKEGAKNGLLISGQKYKKVKIIKKEIK